VDPGIAYQKAAQAAAFAVQDAADYLRNIMTIASTAQGVALKLFLETKDPFYEQVIQQAQSAVSSAANNLEAVGKSATSVATDFPR
jgi:coenzyme F420-reducing hydrogenase alpha subunit